MKRGQPAPTPWEEENRRLLDLVLFGEALPGRSEAARELITRLYQEIEEGAVSAEAIALLRHAFGQIAWEGKSADEAFGLTSDRRKVTAGNLDRAVCIAAFVVLRERQISVQQKLGRRPEGEGSPLVVAQGEAAGRFFGANGGDRAVQRAYDAHRVSVSPMSDEELMQVAEWWPTDPRA